MIVKVTPHMDTRNTDFCIWPQKKGFLVEVRLPSSAANKAILETTGAPLLPRNEKAGRYRLTVNEASFENVCATLAGLSKDIFHDSVRQV